MALSTLLLAALSVPCVLGQEGAAAASPPSYDAMTPSGEPSAVQDELLRPHFLRHPAEPPPMLANILSEDPPPCTAEEHTAIMALNALSTKIKGKALTNKTVQPEIAPLACDFPVMNFQQAVLCYYSWGFKKEIAVCWAKERVAKASTCGQACNFVQPFTAKYDECNQCKAALKAERQNCVFATMGLQQECSNCLLRADQWWDQRCVLQCSDMSNGGVAFATESCRRCNDAHQVMVDQCSPPSAGPAPAKPEAQSVAGEGKDDDAEGVHDILAAGLSYEGLKVQESEGGEAQESEGDEEMEGEGDEDDEEADDEQAAAGAGSRGARAGIHATTSPS